MENKHHQFCIEMPVTLIKRGGVGVSIYVDLPGGFNTQYSITDAKIQSDLNELILQIIAVKKALSVES